MKKAEQHTTRRDFLKKSSTTIAGLSIGLGMAGAPIVKPILGANDKIRVGFIGIGNRGTKLLKSFMSHQEVEVAGLSDAYEPYLLRDNSKVDKRIQQEVGGKVPPMNEGVSKRVPRYKDFRELLDQKDIDAVCVATPDHWHSLIAMMAINAGKDVYVEKPLTVAIKEGRRLVEMEQASDRIVQVGINRRGSVIYRELAEMMRDGEIGQISLARGYRISNMFPNGIGQRPTIEPPNGFDWDMWLGPREYRPYQLNIAPYKFRWWDDYSSQMANWGVHYLDAIRWLMGERAPAAVTAHGGKYVLKDDRTIPDTMEVTFEFGSGALAVFGVYEASGGRMLPYGEIELQGTKGNLYSDQGGYRIEPTNGGQFQDRGKIISPKQRVYEPEVRNDMRNTPTEGAANLISNFLECVKSRNKSDLLCNVEEGHRSTSFALLANLALKTGTRLEWDADREIVTNNKFANQYLDYEYRQKWNEVLDSLV